MVITEEAITHRLDPLSIDENIVAPETELVEEIENSTKNTEVTETEDFMVSEEVIDSTENSFNQDLEYNEYNEEPGYEIKNDEEIEELMNQGDLGKASFIERLFKSDHLTLFIIGFVLAVVVIAVLGYFCFKNGEPRGVNDYHKGDLGSDV